MTISSNARMVTRLCIANARAMGKRNQGRRTDSIFMNY